MAELKIAAIKRSGVYSPNHVANDANILNLVAEQLRKRGCFVKLYTEDELNAGKVNERLIISMCREQASLATLERLENDGAVIINRPMGITNCLRERMTRILKACDLPFPESLVTGTNVAVIPQLESMGISKCWVKRADDYPRHKEDVTFVRSTTEAQEVLQEYFLRGITRAVITRHVKGEIIKFYGVGDIFFHWDYPYDAEHPHGPAEDEAHTERALKLIGRQAAEELMLDVWGGDAVITPEGNIMIIDFNDWPSFAPCREKASVAIAKYIISTFRSARS